MQERIDADKGAPPVGPYSPAVRANGLIFTSGQIPLNPETGEIVGDSIQDQVRQALENLKTLLESPTISPAPESQTRLLAHSLDTKRTQSLIAITLLTIKTWKPPEPPLTQDMTRL